MSRYRPRQWQKVPPYRGSGEKPRWIKVDNLSRADKDLLPEPGTVWKIDHMVNFINKDDMAVVRALDLLIKNEEDMFRMVGKEGIRTFLKSVHTTVRDSGKISEKQLTGVRNVLTKIPGITNWLTLQANRKLKGTK